MDGRDRLLDALALYERLGDERNVAAILNSLGLAAGEQCDFTGAEDFFARSIAIFRRLGAALETGSVLNNIGQNAVRLQNLEAARIALNESLAILRLQGGRFHIAHTLENLADLHCQTGDFSAARAALAECISLRESLGSRDNAETTLATLSRIAFGEGNADAAARLHGAACTALADGTMTANPALSAQLGADRDRLIRALGPALFANLFDEGRNIEISGVLAEDGSWRNTLDANDAGGV
jgi:tetratricopeptide (TPR) repeat protein